MQTGEEQAGEAEGASWDGCEVWALAGALAACQMEEATGPVECPGSKAGRLSRRRCASLGGACQAVWGFAEEWVTAALTLPLGQAGRVQNYQSCSAEVVLWTAWGAEGVGGWEPVSGRGCSSIAGGQKYGAGQQKAEHLLGLTAGWEEKGSSWGAWGLEWHSGSLAAPEVGLLALEGPVQVS